MNFNDLQFKPRFKETPNLGDQATKTFSNGYTISVLKGPLFYSNGVDTFEVAILRGNEVVYDTGITDDVLGHQSKEEVTELMNKVASLEALNE